MQRGQIKMIVNDESRHAGPALESGDRYAIHAGVDHAGTRGNRLSNLGSGDILAFPSKRIPYSIDKIEIPAVIEPHQIAGPEPCIARRKYITQNLLLGIAAVGVTLE